jgi:hypothetical protein
MLGNLWVVVVNRCIFTLARILNALWCGKLLYSMCTMKIMGALSIPLYTHTPFLFLFLFFSPNPHKIPDHINIKNYADDIVGVVCGLGDWALDGAACNRHVYQSTPSTQLFPVAATRLFFSERTFWR